MKMLRGRILMVVTIVIICILFLGGSTLYAADQKVPAAAFQVKAAKLVDLTCEIKAFYDKAQTKPVLRGEFLVRSKSDTMYISLYVKNEGVKDTGSGFANQLEGDLPTGYNPAYPLLCDHLAPGQTCKACTLEVFTGNQCIHEYPAGSGYAKGIRVIAKVDIYNFVKEVDAKGNSLKGNNTCHLVVTFKKAY